MMLDFSHGILGPAILLVIFIIVVILICRDN